MEWNILCSETFWLINSLNDLWNPKSYYRVNNGHFVNSVHIIQDHLKQPNLSIGLFQIDIPIKSIEGILIILNFD